MTLPFMFPTRLILGRGTFGAFSPLAFDALFAAVGHYWIAQCAQRKEQCVVSVRDSVIICCALLYVYDFLIYWSKQCLKQKFQG